MYQQIAFKGFCHVGFAKKMKKFVCVVKKFVCCVVCMLVCVLYTTASMKVLDIDSFTSIVSRCCRF